MVSAGSLLWALGQACSEFFSLNTEDRKYHLSDTRNRGSMVNQSSSHLSLEVLACSVKKSSAGGQAQYHPTAASPARGWSLNLIQKFWSHWFLDLVSKIPALLQDFPSWDWLAPCGNGISRDVKGDEDVGVGIWAFGVVPEHRVLCPLVVQRVLKAEEFKSKEWDT